MKESKTTYAYLIEHMQEPSFLKVWDVAYDFIRKLPGELCDELHESLNRGVDVLDSEPLLQMYIYAFGKMHNAKLLHAFNYMQERVVKTDQLEIVDYGCGQGLASICYHDFIKEHNPQQKITKITLIEPSQLALSRAELLCSCFYPDAEIVAVNKQFDDMDAEDIKISSEVLTLHLFSNILDVESYDINHLSQLVNNLLSKENEYVIVSPIQNAVRTQRLRTFASNLNGYMYYEQYLEKRQLVIDRDWTCAVILVTDRKDSKDIVLNGDDIFEKAISIGERKNLDKSSEECRVIFCKLFLFAQAGDARFQNLLGLYYLDGIGTEENPVKALEWLNKSAEQGYISAYTNLGNQYLEGKNVKKDIKKAVEYFRKSAELGCRGGQTRLAGCYIKGEGVEKDYVKAHYWLEKAAEQDYPLGLFYLGICYLNGYGTDVDVAQAIELFTRAAKMDHEKSIKILIQLFKKKNGIEYFGETQYDIFVKAAQMGMQEVLPIFVSDVFPSSAKVHKLDINYSYEDIYDSLKKTIKNNYKRDEDLIFTRDLSEIHDAFFIFDALSHLSLQPNKSIGFYARHRYNVDVREVQHFFELPGNSLFPYVRDSNVKIKDLVIERESNIPSNFVAAPICGDSFWEIFLLDNLEYFLPKFDHYNYLSRSIILPNNRGENLPSEIEQYIQEAKIDLEPSITAIHKNLIQIQCVYYSAWKGLVRWYDYYLYDANKSFMKVSRLNGISNYCEVIYKYDCGIRI